MTLFDIWILALPAEWDALGTDDGDGGIIPFNYTWSQAVTGYWLTAAGGFEVYNVQGPIAEVDALVAALPSTADTDVYAWDYAASGPTGYDSYDTAYPTDPTPILAVMKPHIVYDENGNEVSSTPATFDTPNWGHSFLGQGERIFAGQFSDEFSTEFF
jgi:hypothetical protein